MQMWNTRNVPVKGIIMEELARNDFQLKPKKLGEIIGKSFGFALFKNSQEDWWEQQMNLKLLKKRKTFGADYRKEKKQKLNDLNEWKLYFYN